MEEDEKPLDLPVAEISRLNVGLPKWPQMYVTGVPVTEEQAKEIIRRTDTFFTRGYNGNEHDWNRKVSRALKMPFFDHTLAWWGKSEEWKKRWGVISTAYVHNSWVSCSFIGGPHGWCHPNGNIGFIDNVGKWPSAESVLRDWMTLAEEFPFLDIGVTLNDGESCEETCPVIAFSVKNGKVRVVVDDESTRALTVHARHPVATRSPDSKGDDIDFSRLFARRLDHEQGIPYKWIQEWAVVHGN